MTYIDEKAVLCLLRLCEAAGREDLHRDLSAAWRNYRDFADLQLRPVTAETQSNPAGEEDRLMHALTEHRERGWKLVWLYQWTLEKIEERRDLIKEQAAAVRKEPEKPGFEEGDAEKGENHEN
jgi:hypothetical protein